MSREQIVNRLQTFRMTPTIRQKQFIQSRQRLRAGDYGHNPDGFAAICRMASKWKGKKITGIISVAGDREDRIVKEAAKVAAGCFHRVIATEDTDRRGRAPGEIPMLLCETISSENPEKICEIVTDEAEAFAKAIREMDEDEVIVIFYDKLSAILEILEQNQAIPVSSFDEMPNAGQSVGQY
jgi:cyanophycin synthetase